MRLPGEDAQARGAGGASVSANPSPVPAGAGLPPSHFQARVSPPGSLPDMRRRGTNVSTETPSAVLATWRIFLP